MAVDVTGLRVGALVVPASTRKNGTTELMMEHLTEQCVAGRLDLVLVDRGGTAAARPGPERLGPEPRAPTMAARLVDGLPAAR